MASRRGPTRRSLKMAATASGMLTFDTLRPSPRHTATVAGLRAHSCSNPRPSRASIENISTAAYNSAIGAGRFSDTYADDTVAEYWAEGVQSWFNTNLESIPANGVHNEINTRAEMEEYDPELYGILAEVLPDEPSYQDCYYYYD